MKESILAAFACALAGCATTATYHRHHPRNVDTVMQRAQPEPRVLCRRGDGGDLELRLVGESRVTAERTLVYNTRVFERGYGGNVLLELLEIPLGIAAFPIWGPLALSGAFEGPEDEDTRNASWNRWHMAFSFVSPAISGFDQAWNTKFDPSLEVFKDPPVTTTYDVRLPLPARTIEARWTDESGETLAEETTVSDRFGRFQLKARHQAGALVMRTEGRTIKVPITACAL
jgi:hypothetical protein